MQRWDAALVVGGAYALKRSDCWAAYSIVPLARTLFVCAIYRPRLPLAWSGQLVRCPTVGDAASCGTGGDWPLLCFDDLSSELDRGHKDAFCGPAGMGQVMIPDRPPQSSRLGAECSGFHVNMEGFEARLRHELRATGQALTGLDRRLL